MTMSYETKRSDVAGGEPLGTAPPIPHYPTWRVCHAARTSRCAWA